MYDLSKIDYNLLTDQRAALLALGDILNEQLADAVIGALYLLDDLSDTAIAEGLVSEAAVKEQWHKSCRKWGIADDPDYFSESED